MEISDMKKIALCARAKTRLQEKSIFLQSVSPKSRVSAMNLSPRICHLLSFLKIHKPDCEHCAARLTCGAELRKRLQELNAQTPSLISGGIIGIELRISPLGTSPRRPGRPYRQGLRTLSQPDESCTRTSGTAVRAASD